MEQLFFGELLPTAARRLQAIGRIENRQVSDHLEAGRIISQTEPVLTNSGFVKKRRSCWQLISIQDHDRPALFAKGQHHFHHAQPQHGVQQQWQNCDHEQGTTVAQLVTNLAQKNQFDVFPAH